MLSSQESPADEVVSPSSGSLPVETVVCSSNSGEPPSECSSQTSEGENKPLTYVYCRVHY